MSNRKNSGPKHYNWKGGMRVNRDGYLQYTAVPLRGLYVHRVVADKQLMESHGRHLRPDEEVHHQNFIKTCNHDFNLIIMDYAIHRGISGWLHRLRGKKKK